MRLMVVLLLVPFFLSGCSAFGCDDYIRTARWDQEDVPLAPSGQASAVFGDHWGVVGRDRDDNRLDLSVWGNNSVSHDELVQFAEALFASKGWPPPRLEGAEEYAGCGDHY